MDKAVVKRVSTIILISIAMFTVYVTPNENMASNIADVCTKLYFYNAIKIYESAIADTLLLETPVNISLMYGFTQRSLPAVSHMVIFNESAGYYTFTVKPGEGFNGFFVNIVEICTKPLGIALGYINMALRDPSIDPFNSSSINIPEEIARDFLTIPREIVVEKVVPSFEEWFTNKYKMSLSNASKLGIAVTAGYFVYMVYIRYNASAVPRGIEDVVESREGDCDDMSRILAELLNYYGIPSVIVYGYVYIEGMKFVFPIENVTYIYVNSGPHAFTMAYIPGFGWFPLDFLAGSFITQPFILEGYSRSTHIDEESVDLFLDLHRKINAIQVLGVFKETNKPVGDIMAIDEWLGFFNEIVATQNILSPEIAITETTEEPVTNITTDIGDTALEPSLTGTTQVNETRSHIAEGEATTYVTNNALTETFIQTTSPSLATTVDHRKTSPVDVYVIVLIAILAIVLAIFMVYRRK
ncbi:MAG: transglutaminase family protein [Desulfurococcaceae archaeon]